MKNHPEQRQRVLIRTIIVMVIAVIAVVRCPSVADAAEGSNAEAAFAAQFSRFFEYDDDARAMTPMTLRGAEQEATPQIADYKGKTILLHFWATWCPPCITELPTLAKLAAQRHDLVVLPVSLDYGLDQAVLDQFMKKYGAGNLKPLRIPREDKAWDTVTGFALPTSFIINPQGRVLYKMTGDINWTSPETLGFIDHLLTNQEK